MSLAFGIDVAEQDVTTRVTALLGTLMVVALVLAALEQWRDEDIGSGSWLGLAAAVACAAWCVFLLRRQAARRPLRLRVAADGSVTLAAGEGGDEVAAALVAAWRLGSLACLRLRPAVSQFGSSDCLVLLARGTVGDARWHALRRWLVWQRRSAGRRDTSRPRATVAA